MLKSCSTIPVEKLVLYEKCGKCDRIALEKARKKYECRKKEVDAKYHARMVGYDVVFISFVA